MPINNRCVLASTIAVVALFAATGVRANPAHQLEHHALLHGAGFGVLSAVPTPRSKGSSAVFAALDLHGPWAQRSRVDADSLAGKLTTPSSLALSIDDARDVGSTAFDLDAVQVEKGPTVSVNQSSLVTAVPEPDTYALLLAGLAAVGFMARRQPR